MRRRVRKLIEDLEARVDELEERLSGRDWSQPIPRNTVEMDDLPEWPDYSAGWDEDGADDVWNPTTYL